METAFAQGIRGYSWCYTNLLTYALRQVTDCQGAALDHLKCSYRKFPVLPCIEDFFFNFCFNIAVLRAICTQQLSGSRNQHSVYCISTSKYFLIAGIVCVGVE